jgi:hypothetical protein
LPGLDSPVRLRCTLIYFASPLLYLELWPRGHAIEQHFFQ